MQRFTLVLIITTMAAAGTASGTAPQHWRGQSSKAKNFIMNSIPASWQKAFLGTAVGLLLMQPLVPAVADNHQQVVQEQGSDTALQQQVVQEEDSGLKLGKQEMRLFPAQDDMYDVLLKLRTMKTYDPDFADTVAAGEEKLAQMLRAEAKDAYKISHPSDKFRVSHATQQLHEAFKHLTEGIEGREGDVIAWTVWHSGKGSLVGIDFLDIQHYRTVKDILTAADYDGVSVHYFVDGESRRGVAELIHPELKTQVRVGSEVIDIAQISGVLITRRPIYDVFDRKKRPLLAITRPQRFAIDTQAVVAPQDLLAYLPHPNDYVYAGGRYAEAYDEAQETAGANIVWRGQIKKHLREAEFYSDGYGELLIYAADVGEVLVIAFAEGRKDFSILFNWQGLPPSTIHARGSVWENYTSDVLASVYGEGINVLAIADAYLNHYLAAQDTFTASDYTGVLVRYRTGDGMHTAQVRGAEDGAEDRAVVVDLIGDAEQIIAVSDIQGVVRNQHDVYGKAATIKVDDTTYYGEVILAFSNDELSVLVHAKRQGEGEIELLEDKYPITMPRDRTGLILQ